MSKKITNIFGEDYNIIDLVSNYDFEINDASSNCYLISYDYVYFKIQFVDNNYCYCLIRVNDYDYMFFAVTISRLACLKDFLVSCYLSAK